MFGQAVLSELAITPERRNIVYMRRWLCSRSGGYTRVGEFREQLSAGRRNVNMAQQNAMMLIYHAAGGVNYKHVLFDTWCMHV